MVSSYLYFWIPQMACEWRALRLFLVYQFYYVRSIPFNFRYRLHRKRNISIFLLSLPPLEFQLFNYTCNPTFFNFSCAWIIFSLRIYYAPHLTVGITMFTALLWNVHYPKRNKPVLGRLLKSYYEFTNCYIFKVLPL